MTPLEEYWHTAFTRVHYAGFAWEIEYVKNIPPPEKQTIDSFFREYLWVCLCSTGLKEQIVRKTFDKFWDSFNGRNNLESFGIESENPFWVIRNKRLREAAYGVFTQRKEHFKKFLNADDKIEFLDSLPQMGPATKYHLARNLGIDCIKPDRHLRNIADRWGFKTPEILCQEIVKFTGLKLGIIDIVLWRYCNLTGDYGIKAPFKEHP